jgi:hypothetical protein
MGRKVYSWQLSSVLSLVASLSRVIRVKSAQLAYGTVQSLIFVRIYVPNTTIANFEYGLRFHKGALPWVKK